MVIEDLSSPKINTETEVRPAEATTRVVAGFIDAVLLSPLVAFVPAYHLKLLLMDSAQGFDSDLGFHVFVLGFLTHVMLQTGFTYFFRATPGQAAMGIKVKSLVNGMTWNQALLRSLFFTLSWIFLGLPLLEAAVHPYGRCWHDRVSDTAVVTTRRAGRRARGANGALPAVSLRSRHEIRTIMILGYFMLFMIFASVLTQKDRLTFGGDLPAEDNIDVLVARALLKKDTSDETKFAIEEKLWNARSRQEKALAYFFRFQIEKDEEVRKALSHQICEWQAPTLCSLTSYSLQPDPARLADLKSKVDRSSFLSVQVALMRVLTRESQIAQALALHKQLRQEDVIKDELKAWDVSLYLQARALTEKNRAPASDEIKKIIETYEKERAEP
ncbi:MAG: RDD family protein [Bdellovibrionales bacterium]